jgi:hypothetical protein
MLRERALVAFGLKRQGGLIGITLLPSSGTFVLLK